MLQPPIDRIGTELIVKFQASRDGDPMAIIDGKISFPARRNTQIAEIGQCWLVEVTGTNPKGTVYFLRLIEPCVYHPTPDGRLKLWFEPSYNSDSSLCEIEGPAPDYSRHLEPTFYHPALENMDRQELYDDVDFEELLESDTDSAFADQDDDPHTDWDSVCAPGRVSVEWYRHHYRIRH